MARSYRCVLAEKFSGMETLVSKRQKQMNQLEFATFIEDNLDDIAPVDGMPSRADLLEMILKFEANQDSRLKQHVRLQSGGIELNFVNSDDEQTIQRMKMFEKSASASRF